MSGRPRELWQPTDREEIEWHRKRGEICALCRWSRPSRMYPDGLAGYPVSECLLHHQRWGPLLASHPRQTWPSDGCDSWDDGKPRRQPAEPEYSGDDIRDYLDEIAAPFREP